jgi:hypothetical protein
MTDNLPASAPEPTGEIILYQTEDGANRIEVRLEGETVLLSQRGMAELFQTSVPNVNHHLKTIYEDGELHPEATIKRYLIVQTEGSRQVSRAVDHYNLDAILAVGYRVRSHRGVQFRTWATDRLREYLIKGFALDDDRLKRAGGGNYFEERSQACITVDGAERLHGHRVRSGDIIYSRRGDVEGRVLNGRGFVSGRRVGFRGLAIVLKKEHNIGFRRNG